MLASCLVNLLLNIILIPRYDILGAAIATMASYSLYITLVIITSMKKLPFQLQYFKIATYFTSSVIMYLVINLIAIQSLVFNIAVKVIIGLFLYFALVITADAELRDKVMNIRFDGTLYHIFQKISNKEKYS
jgi:O-antigen/teichoic acid export membrane protein